MEKQEEIVRQFFAEMEKKQGQSPKELSPRDGEKYRFTWQMSGGEGKSYYEMFQMGDCLYLTADAETSAEYDELKMLQLLNWLNGWSHYGTFTYDPSSNLVLYEQTHFCRYFEYNVHEIDDFFKQMIKRMSIYFLSADTVTKGETDVGKAVDMAMQVVETLHN